MDEMSANTLYGRHLSKTDFRNTVLSRVLPLDASEPPRKPDTGQEVAKRVDLELDMRIDARQPREALHATVATGVLSDVSLLPSA